MSVCVVFFNQHVSFTVTDFFMKVSGISFLISWFFSIINDFVRGVAHAIGTMMAS